MSRAEHGQNWLADAASSGMVPDPIAICMRTSGSVLVEVLSVFFMLGVFAVVAIPDFKDGPSDPRLHTLVGALDEVRAALDRYRDDHDGAFPDLETLQALEDASPSDGTRRLIDYIDRIPDNPFTNKNHVGSTDEEPAASDWVYDSETGAFNANDRIEHRAL